MLNISRHIRRTSKLIVGLFALQILVTGFCLMTPQVHAAEINMASSTTVNMSSHCPSNDSIAASEMQHDSACTHCEMPSELISSKITLADIHMDAPILLLLVATIQTDDTSVAIPPLQHSDALPRSSSIIYHTSSRILI